jgi:hypothetical protein
MAHAQTPLSFESFRKSSQDVVAPQAYGEKIAQEISGRLQTVQRAKSQGLISSTRTLLNEGY